MLKKIEANIKAHKKANELLYQLPVTFECHNEFHINWEKTFKYREKQIGLEKTSDSEYKIITETENIK